MGGLFAMNDPERYSRKWDEYHRRQKLFLAAWALFFPGILIVGWLFRTLTGMTFGHSGLGAFVIFGGCCIAAQNYLERWRCPRCAEYFCRSAIIHWPLAVCCLHCGLRRYSTDDELTG